MEQSKKNKIKDKTFINFIWRKSLPLHLVSSYRVGLDISISLEFRTSKTSGVLLAVSNQASDGLGLEIVQGKVNN